MFSIRAKERPIPSISASDSSKFQFYICFQSFRPDYLSVFHDEDTVPPQEIHIGLSVSVRQTPNAPFVLSYPPTARHHVAAEQEAQDFRPRRPTLTLLTP